MRLRPLLFAVMLIGTAIHSLRAQARSPVQDLITEARGALNDLRYADADSITQAILAYPELRRSDRIQALQLAAGALFPEQESARRRDRVQGVLQQLVRIAPTAGLPKEVTWPGLDDVYRIVFQETFGASVTVQEKNVVTGPSEAAEVVVVASRPTKFILSATPSGGTPILLDSITTQQRASLRMRVLAERRPLFRSGNYQFEIIAIDVTGPDTIFFRYSGHAEVAALELVPVPDRFDDSKLLPEVTRPKRALGIVGGALVAVGTIVAASVLREDALKQGGKSDGRAVPLGIVLGGIGAGGVWLLDHGKPIPENVAANRGAREAFERSVAAARGTNEERIRTYRAELTINPEAR